MNINAAYQSMTIYLYLQFCYFKVENAVKKYILFAFYNDKMTVISPCL